MMWFLVGYISPRFEIDSGKCQLRRRKNQWQVRYREDSPWSERSWSEWQWICYAQAAYFDPLQDELYAKGLAERTERTWL